MREISLSEFKRMKAATNRKLFLSFSIMLDGTMRINGKLKDKLTTNCINVFSIPDGTVVAIQSVESDAPDACRVSKDGNVKVPELQIDLEAANIKLPARYLAEWNDKLAFWQAEIDKEYCFRAAHKPDAKKKTNKTPHHRRKLPN